MIKFEICLNFFLGDRLDRFFFVFCFGDCGFMLICIVDDKRFFLVENLV